MNFENKEDFIYLFWSETILQKNGHPYNNNNIIDDELLLNFGAKFQR